LSSKANEFTNKEGCEVTVGIGAAKGIVGVAIELPV